MKLTFVLLTSTDTAAPACAYLTPALVTFLSAIRVFRLGEERKLRGPLKTIVLPLPPPLYVANISRHLANFHPR